MFAPDVRVEGFTSTDWIRLLHVFHASDAPNAASNRSERSGGLLVVHNGHRLRKLLHTHIGRVGFADQPWPVSLADLAQQHKASWVVSLREGALELFMDRLATRVQKDDDGVLHVLTAMDLVKTMVAEKSVQLWPGSYPLLPLSTHSVLSRLLRGICPEGHVVLVGMFEKGELWTSIALRRNKDGIDLIVGPDRLRAAMGLLSGDWRRDYRHLVTAVQRRYGPLATGLFAELVTFRHLVHNGTPGAWARNVAVRDVIVSPLSTAIALPIFVDAIRGVVARGMRQVDEIDWEAITRLLFTRGWPARPLLPLPPQRRGSRFLDTLLGRGHQKLGTQRHGAA